MLQNEKNRADQLNDLAGVTAGEWQSSDWRTGLTDLKVQDRQDFASSTHSQRNCLVLSLEENLLRAPNSLFLVGTPTRASGTPH